jgi:hypothetical protein
MKRIAAIVAVASLSACASAPESIKAKPSAVSYAGSSCASLSASLKTAKAEYEVHSSMQKRFASDDAFETILIGVPASGMLESDRRKMTVDKIATLKGQIEAIEQEQKRAGC